MGSTPGARTPALPVDEQRQRGVAGGVDDHQSAHGVVGVVRELQTCMGGVRGRTGSSDASDTAPAGTAQQACGMSSLWQWASAHRPRPQRAIHPTAWQAAARTGSTLCTSHFWRSVPVRLATSRSTLQQRMGGPRVKSSRRGAAGALPALPPFAPCRPVLVRSMPKASHELERSPGSLVQGEQAQHQARLRMSGWSGGGWVCVKNMTSACTAACGPEPAGHSTGLRQALARSPSGQTQPPAPPI